jgi:hypothetical protein
MFRTRSTALATALVVYLLPAPSPAGAQDVRYESVSRVDFPGAAGTAMRLAARLGGGSMETVETVSIQGRKMRTDVDRSSTILDLDQRRFISIDHAGRTYSIYTFDEMLQQAEQTAAQLRQDVQQVSGADDAQAQFNFRFAVDPANERQRIAGYEAERFFLTMSAEGQYVPEGATEREQAGTLVILTDLWASRDAPAFQALNTFRDASASQYADAGAALMQGMAAAFAEDPRMKVALEQSASEARKIEGMTLRSVTSFVSVAPGQQFSRALVTDPPQQQAGAGAQQAARAAIGRLGGGLIGGRQQQQEAPATAEPPAQATVFTVTSEVRNISTGPLSADLFEVPAGYREVRDGV